MTAPTSSAHPPYATAKPTDGPLSLGHYRDYTLVVTFRPADPLGFCEVTFDEDPADNSELTALVASRFCT
jgi:hypothetical protein